MRHAHLLRFEERLSVRASQGRSADQDSEYCFSHAFSELWGAQVVVVTGGMLVYLMRILAKRCFELVYKFLQSPDTGELGRNWKSDLAAELAGVHVFRGQLVAVLRLLYQRGATGLKGDVH
ncbi:hypothetical protein PG987_008111 [Apiospora arundinis]